MKRQFVSLGTKRILFIWEKTSDGKYISPNIIKGEWRTPKELIAKASTPITIPEEILDYIKIVGGVNREDIYLKKVDGIYYLRLKNAH